MKILIIGNGFDIANDLPTKYSQFLNMCECVISCGHVYDTANNPVCSSANQEKAQLTDFFKSVGKDAYNEFFDLAKGNLFYYHFCDRKNIIGDKWLNIEEEIQKFIENLIAEKKSKGKETYRSSNISALKIFLNNCPNKVETYKDLFETIREQHKNFVRLLEIYMDGYVNQIPPKKLLCFKKGFYDHVISFNYTDTYSEKYEPELGCCYIHGKAIIDRDKPCQIVLGFDNKNMYPDITEIEMLPYVKFFQRLDLKTSVDYMDWLKAMDIEEENLVDIYGHSLAFSDADIISGFIRKPRTKTRIYYYDKLDRYDKLRNLTLLLGTKDTIELVSGKDNHCIDFIPTENYTTRLLS
jgi:hypothetical protein